MVSTCSTQVAACARTRLARRRPAAPSACPASMATAASRRPSRVACSTTSQAPRCISATWSGGRVRAVAQRAPATAAAPPNQTAATPMPPHANPGRSRYQPGAPTGLAGTPSKVTVLVVTSTRPRGAQAAGSTDTPVSPRSTANRPAGPSSRSAVTSACETRSASEHHGLAPVSRQRPSSPRRAATRVPGGAAAYTPQVAPSGSGVEACARMATASQCGSTVRAVVRSTLPRVANDDRTRQVSRPIERATCSRLRASARDPSMSPATDCASSATPCSPHCAKHQGIGGDVTTSFYPFGARFIAVRCPRNCAVEGPGGGGVPVGSSAVVGGEQRRR